jgi:hypothetical protein
MRLRDAGVSAVARWAINRHIRSYGKVLKSRIDSKSKTIELELWLKGERENISAKLEGYEIIHVHNASFIRYKRISASREWMNSVVQNLIPRKLEIPRLAAKAIALLL